MREFEQKKIIRKTIYSKIVAFFLLIILLFLLHGTYNVYKKSRESHRQLEMIQNKVAELEEKKEKLGVQIEDLKSPVGQEEEARSRYLLAKEDEHTIVIIDKETETIVTEEPSFMESIWDKFISLITF
jgi:cell division protein FtsB